MISIIIPAHNEGTVIERCLAVLTQGAQADELEIIVVCNGCSDDTAAKATQAWEQAHIIETDIASKSHALNLGDAAASGYPRFYVDADILLPIESLRRVSAQLQQEGLYAAAPRMDIDLDGRSWFVRAFYQVWLELPYCRSGMIGSGVYALSKQGRERFTEFPTVTADDGYVRLLFSAQERRTIEDCSFTITPPRTLGGLVAIKTRAHFGNIELKARFPDLWPNEEADHQTGLLLLLRKPKWWPALSVYIYVRFLSRWKAHWRYRFGDHAKWERDDTSREFQRGSREVV